MSSTVRPSSKPEMRGSITVLVLGDGKPFFFPSAPRVDFVLNPTCSCSFSYCMTNMPYILFFHKKRALENPV